MNLENIPKFFEEKKYLKRLKNALSVEDIFEFLNEDHLRKELRSARIDKIPEQIIRYSLIAPAIIFLLGLILSLLFLSGVYLIISLLSVLIVTAISFISPYYYLKIQQGDRRRKINRDLGSAITFMYALSSGNMRLPEIFRRLAIYDNAFGEVSKEAKLIVTEIDFFSSDLESAINELILTTPSENMKDFLVDLIPVMRAGGDVSSYLSDKSQQYLDQAIEEQENFIEFLGYLSEGYIAGFVAGPLLIILGLVMLILSFGQAPTPLYYIIYLLLPLGGLFFVVLLKLVSPIESKAQKTQLERTQKTGDELKSPKRQKTELEVSLKERTKNLYKSTISEPNKTLLFSIPLFLIFLTYIYLTQGVNPIWDSIEMYSMILMLISLAPIAVFYEIRNYRETKIRNEFPDLLRVLEGLNKTGMTLKKTLLEASGIPGIVGKSLKDVKRGLKWNFNLKNLIKYFANELNEINITRSVIIILEGTRAHGNISSVLKVTKEDSIKRKKLKEKRKMNIRPYILLVWVAFLVFLLTSYIFQVQFLGSIPKGGLETGRFGFSMGQVEMIKDIIGHSSMIMGFISGIIAGELSKGTILAGIKHAIVMVSVSYLIFYLII